MMEQDNNYLLDPRLLHRLERMQVVSRRLARGSQSGKRRSRNTGSSIEFADYRSYTPGDDLRQLDWNAYARTGKLFVKKYLDEQELHISLYLDTSKSMSYGEPSKFSLAVQLAAAIGYLSLCHYDYLSVYAYDRRVHASLRFLHGKEKAQRLFQFLCTLQPDGSGDLNQSIHSGAAVHGKTGVSFVFSDFLFESGYERGLNFLQATNQEVTLVQLLSKEERDPAYEGALRLLDSESGEPREIAFTPKLLCDYQASLEAYQTRLSSYAYRRGMRHLLLDAEVPIETTLFQIFRQAGIIR